MEELTFRQFEEAYPDDDACLNEIFNNRFGSLKECPSCLHDTRFHRVKGRKCYKCQRCAYELHPLADTIFHKSSTRLKDWFRAIYLFSNSKNGVSAKELERHLGVTYKTAWRIANRIRLLFEELESEAQLSEVVEADETCMGSIRRGKYGRGAEGKTPVIGIVQRGGKVKASVTTDTKACIVLPFIQNNVKPGTQAMTDEYGSYKRVSLHKTVKHGLKQYVLGDCHTNIIEGFWSQLKRSVNGTYHSVSPKYLQSYVNEFSYLYNHRNSSEHLFSVLIPKAAKLV